MDGHLRRYAGKGLRGWKNPMRMIHRAALIAADLFMVKFAPFVESCDSDKFCKLDVEAMLLVMAAG